MKRLSRIRSEESGFTLVELLVASAMGAIVMSSVAMLMISAVRDQPRISQQAQNISTARWVLERMTRELRGGIALVDTTSSKVSFEAYVRHTTCGGTAQLPSTASPIVCLVTYECTTTACFRSEAPKGGGSGTPRQIFSGIDSNQVFTPVPSEEPTYVKVTLRLPNPSGNGDLTISDGASLRNATLGY
jgi:prepilin-type N-terminal cleavage/methylation domain-containing protein